MHGEYGLIWRSRIMSEEYDFNTNVLIITIAHVPGNASPYQFCTQLLKGSQPVSWS